MREYWVKKGNISRIAVNVGRNKTHVVLLADPEKMNSVQIYLNNILFA